MAKGNRGSVPTIEPFKEDEAEFVTAAPQVIESPPAQAEALRETRTERPDLVDAQLALSIDLPSGEVPGGYCSPDVSATMSDRQKTAFAMLLDGLDKSSARIENGEHVGRTRAKVVQWLMDRVADAYGI